MKQVSTIFLRIAVVFIGTPVLTLCIFGLYNIFKNPINQDYANMIYPILIVMYLSVIPFFAALYQTLKLLKYIDKNEAFCEVSVKILYKIKLCAISISVLYILIMPFIYLVADLDDAPGLILVGMIPIFVSMIIAVFAAVLQKLLKNAIDIKSENDLTI